MNLYTGVSFQFCLKFERFVDFLIEKGMTQTSFQTSYSQYHSGFRG
jgi:hypothetical protein